MQTPISSCALRGIWEIGTCRLKSGIGSFAYDRTMSSRTCSVASERISSTCKPPFSPKAAPTAATATLTATLMTRMAGNIIMNDERCRLPPRAVLRLQSWLSPAFPTGSYSYSHGLEWAVDAGHVHDRKSLVDWLEADLCYGSGRNEAIFFSEAWRRAMDDDRTKLFEIAELASAFRGTAELALESTQQAAACLATLRRVWPDRLLDWLSEILCERHIQPALAVVLGVRSASQGIPA